MIFLQVSEPAHFEFPSAPLLEIIESKIKHKVLGSQPQLDKLKNWTYSMYAHVFL